MVMTKLEKRVNVARRRLSLRRLHRRDRAAVEQRRSATDLAILAVMYVLTALGVTVGFHRLLTHRSFQASKPLEYAFAILGSMAVQGPVMTGSPTTASTTRTPTRRATRTARTSATATARAACCAASGTRTRAGCSQTQGQASARRYAKDLSRIAGMRLINRRFPLLVLLSLALPGAGRLGDHRHARGRR